MFKEASMNGVGSDSNDEVLWNQIKAGEMVGLEGLYAKYVRELFRLGMSIKGDRGLVKDCIQEVFLTIWQYRDSVKATDNARLYLFKCLSNRIHKEIGKDKSGMRSYFRNWKMPCKRNRKKQELARSLPQSTEKTLWKRWNRFLPANKK